MGQADRLIVEEDDVDFGAYLSITDAQHKVRAVNAYRQELTDEVNGVSEWGRVAYLPWRKTHDHFAYRKGEVTVYVGMNGHGKSLMLGQIGMSLAAQGEVVLILSFEMKPRRTLARMLRQWGGRMLDRMDVGDVDRFVDWCESRVWLYDQQGTVDVMKVLAVCRWAIEHRGVTHIIIDNLSKCVKGEEDYDGQKDFIDQTTVIARDYNVHLHVLHHPKKLADEDKPPRKYDLKGSGSISDQPDNVMSIWKNKPKMDALQRGDLTKGAEPDALLLIDKQRNGTGWEGRIALAFHHASTQFIESSESAAMDLREFRHGHDRLYSHGFQP
jgi:twinkle protein